MENDINFDLERKIDKKIISNPKCDTLVEAKQVLSRLFEEFSHLGLEFKNHFCFMNLSDDFLFDDSGKPTDKYVKFYQMISSSDVGLIFTGSIYAKEQNFKKSKKDYFLKDILFSDMTKAVHTSGSKIFLTISPVYGRGDKKHQFCGNFSYSASNIPSLSKSNLPCIRLTDGKCEEICEEIANMAKYANFAGFDGVLIKANQFGIVGEFSSLEFNKRKFGYFSETFDFPLKIIKQIINQSPNIVIFYNLTVSSLLTYIYKNNSKNIRSIKKLGKKQTKAKVLELLTKLVKAGVDGFVFEFGTYETEFLCNFNQFQDENFFETVILDLNDFFQKISLKNKFDQPVSIIVKDNYKSLNVPSKLVISKQINFVDVTKDIYSDINFLKSKKTQKPFKNCLKCSHCNDFSQYFGIVDCVINPELRYGGIKFSQTKNAEHVAVVGGGISGLVCATNLAERGFLVDLYEKNNHLNKSGRRCEIFGFDQNLKNYNDYLEEKISQFSSKNTVKVFKNTIFDENIFLDKYKAIVVATGYHERFLEIVGAVLKNVKSIFECLDSFENFENKKNIVIYSKSELSLKLALFLLSKNKNVSLIIPNLKFLKKLPYDRLTYYLYALKILGANVFPFSKIKFIQEDFVELLINNNLKKYDFTSTILNYISGKKYQFEAKAKNIDCDLFVYEPEIYPNNKLFYELVKNNFHGEIYLIGNALEISDLDNDIKTGYFVGKNL